MLSNSSWSTSQDSNVNFFSSDLRDDAVDKRDDFLIFLMVLHDTVVHNVIVNLVCARLNHGDLLRGGRDGDRHLRALALQSRGIEHDFAVHVAYRHAAYRSR